MNKSNKSVQTDLERLDLKVEPNKMLSEKEESQEDYRKEEKEQIKILSEKEESYDFDDTIKMEEELNVFFFLFGFKAYYSEWKHIIKQ